MLSIFPSLLMLQQFSPLLLRLTLGIIFILWGYREWKKRGSGNGGSSVIGKGGVVIYSMCEMLLGLLLVIGLFTQFAALVSAIIFIRKLVGKIANKAFFTDGVNYYFILLIISICLLISGPGLFAFDLPL